MMGPADDEAREKLRLEWMDQNRGRDGADRSFEKFVGLCCALMQTSKRNGWAVGSTFEGASKTLLRVIRQAYVEEMSQ